MAFRGGILRGMRPSVAVVRGAPRMHTVTDRPTSRTGWRRYDSPAAAVPDHTVGAVVAAVGSADVGPSRSAAGSESAGATSFGSRQAWHRPDVAVVLVQPQIPQNTGNVARSCAATATPLHLVGPLGFQLDDKKLKRAGLDYWDSVAVSTHASWAHFFTAFSQLPGPKRLVAFTVYGDTYYGAPEFTYRPGDWLVFGAETSGLPPATHEDVLASGGSLVKIPIRDMHVRSINLAVAAGVGLFEAIRQLDAGAAHTVSPRQSPTLEEVAAAHRDGRPLQKTGGAQHDG